MAMEAQRREELAARIKDLRGRRTQQAIADKVGVTLRAYQAWEAGGGITWDNIELLAGALDVSAEYLLYGETGDQPRASTQLERVEAKLDELLRLMTKLDSVLGIIGEAGARKLSDYDRSVEDAIANAEIDAVTRELEAEGERAGRQPDTGEAAGRGHS